MCVIGFDSQPYFVRIPLLFSAMLHKAGIAQLVEHHLAKVDVESSNLFARSIFKPPEFASGGFFVASVKR